MPSNQQFQITKIVHFKYQNGRRDAQLIGGQSEASIPSFDGPLVLSIRARMVSIFGHIVQSGCASFVGRTLELEEL